MTNTEQYNGWTNRETWAFMLHINNDQGMQQDSYNVAGETLAVNPDQSDYSIGEAVVAHWEEWLDLWTEETGEPLPEGIGASLREDLEAQA